ncbi:hypothetical protein BO71DRAFT_432670 [Aspergillus ellipticus CBS 707.79]|uniref:Uncharacterized protein n=1 Tax=Aspergillus ellipticus CBS 707.79 TaxID=1448320 RepID=A0A319DK49_9EURO|nr:hypothetical protein BO71DRAFT_432670 [Aspergillus ellipticus CBS 707.79]
MTFCLLFDWLASWFGAPWMQPPSANFVLDVLKVRSMGPLQEDNGRAMWMATSGRHEGWSGLLCRAVVRQDVPKRPIGLTVLGRGWRPPGLVRPSLRCGPAGQSGSEIIACHPQGPQAASTSKILPDGFRPQPGSLAAAVAECNVGRAIGARRAGGSDCPVSTAAAAAAAKKG